MMMTDDKRGNNWNEWKRLVDSGKRFLPDFEYQKQLYRERLAHEDAAREYLRKYNSNWSQEFDEWRFREDYKQMWIYRAVVGLKNWLLRRISVIS